MTADKREAIRTLLQRSQIPKSASQLRKELPESVRISGKELAPLLDELVRAGVVFLWPRKMFWDRDPAREIPRRILEFLAGSGPVAAAKIRGALKVPLELIHFALEELVGKGRVYVWQPGKSPSYCLAEPRSAALDIIRNALARGPLTEKDLVNRVRKDLPGYQTKHFREHVSSSQGIFEHPKYGKVKTQYGLKPPEPGPYLTRAVQEVLSVHKLLAPFDIPLEAVHDALRRELGLGRKPEPSTGKPLQGQETSREAEALILDGISRLQPPGQKRALVSIRELRRSLNLEKGVFDRAVLSLALRGNVALHHHDFPSSLNTAEREELVRDEQGTYYIGIVPKERS